MEQNTNQEKQTPAPKKGMSDFRRALLWTAIPIVVFTAIGMPGMIATPYTTWSGFGVFTGIAVGLWGLAILVCIGFAIAHKRQIALGILVGIGIGIIGLGITCFASFSNSF